MGDLSSTYPDPSPLAPSNLVGVFLRAKREAVGLSQRALGQLFEPAVTTQFISNIERGVTPLPPVHIPTLVRVLQLEEADLLAVLEREYAMKITHHFGGHVPLKTARPLFGEGQPADEDRAYFEAIHKAFGNVDANTQDAFHSLCEMLLKVPKPNLSKRKQSG